MGSAEIGVSENQVTLYVEGIVQVNQVTAFKEELTLFLRKNLNNFGIMLDAKTKKVEESKQVAYTSQEKFALLAETNPALLKLKEMLQLETN